MVAPGRRRLVSPAVVVGLALVAAIGLALVAAIGLTLVAAIGLTLVAAIGLTLVAAIGLTLVAAIGLTLVVAARLALVVASRVTLVVAIRLALVAVASMLLQSVASAQARPPGSPAVNRELERLLTEPSEEQGDLELEDLLWLHEHPLDLRRVSSTELAQLPSIDLQVAIAIVDVVRRLQPRSLRELSTTIDLSPLQLLTLRAFTSLAVDTAMRQLRGSVRLRLERDLAARRGFRERLLRVVVDGSGTADTIDAGTPYRGAPEALMLQLALSRGPLSFAATVATDRGEPIVHRDTTRYTYARLESVADSSPPGAVHTRLAASASVSLAWQGPSLTVVAGDYTAELGQGLALADGRRRFSPIAGAASAYVAARRLAPYRSSDETSYLRGIAAEATVERALPFRLRLLAFGSWRWRDATLDSMRDSAGRNVPIVATLRRDGNRRTTSEIRRSGNALERLAGAGALLERERWAVGLSVLRSDLRADGGPITRRNTTWSLDARLSSRHLTLYGECALGRGAPALVAGAIVRRGAVSCALAGRIIPVGTDVQGRAFPQSGAPSAERGLFATLEAPIAERLSLVLGIDVAYRPESTASVPFPHSTVDARLRLEWTQGPVRAELKLDRSRRPAGESMTDAIGRRHRGLVDIDRTRAGIVVQAEPDAAFMVRLRLDWRTVNLSGAGSSDGIGATAQGSSTGSAGPAGTSPVTGDISPASSSGRALLAASLSDVAARGALGAVDIRVRPGGPLEVLAGFAIFGADDAEAAVHAVEADLPGRIRSVALVGAGRRLFAALRWDATAALRVSLSVSETFYADRRTIGNGLDAIAGARHPAASLQVDWKLGAASAADRSSEE